mgnify:FL=1
MILICGLPGTGKTYFASRLAEALQTHHLNTDGTRDRLGLRGVYTPEVKEQVYHSMFELGGQYLQWGEDVVFDATFHKANRRRQALDAAREKKAQVYFIEIIARELLIRNRLDRPRPDSEADEMVYHQLREDREEIMLPHLTLISGDQKIDDMIAMAQHYLEGPALDPHQL